MEFLSETPAREFFISKALKEAEEEGIILPQAEKMVHSLKANSKKK